MPDLTLTRGDRATIAISDLVDGNCVPAVFGAGDVVRWTAKADLADTTAEALLAKTSADGGVTIALGGSTATVNIVPADWTALQLRGDLKFVWDLQLEVGGNPAQIVTLAEGDGLIRADVTDNPITEPIPSGGLNGPCSPWVTVGEASADPRAVRADGSPLPPGLLAEKIDVASELLYRLSGRQYAGQCTDVVRPTARWYRTDMLPWSRWTYAAWPRTADSFTALNPHRYAGATALQEITLGAYPLRDIIEVRVNGSVVDSATYRIDDRRWLVNLDLTAPWPNIQSLELDPLTDDNTFQVTFAYGQAPPRMGVAACKRYAIELAKGAVGDPCAIPERVLSLQMPGASYTIVDAFTFLGEGLTGLYEVDSFLKAVNPNGLKRKSAVYSPDIPRPVRRTSTVPGS